MKGKPLSEDSILISALNQYAFCPRRCALMHVEGIWRDNEHTTEGSLLHDHADTPGYETSEDVTILRALPLSSAKYGLAGKADIVELRDGEPAPVEYKKGKRRRFENDDIQLCAQAFCLEEMFKTEVPIGYVYHASSRRRREVIFDWRLRRQTEQAIVEVRRMLEQQTVPPAELKPRCDGCSLRAICMPELTGLQHSAAFDRYRIGLWE